MLHPVIGYAVSGKNDFDLGFMLVRSADLLGEIVSFALVARG